MLFKYFVLKCLYSRDSQYIFAQVHIGYMLFSNNEQVCLFVCFLSKRSSSSQLKRKIIGNLELLDCILLSSLQMAKVKSETKNLWSPRSPKVNLLYR